MNVLCRERAWYAALFLTAAVAGCYIHSSGRDGLTPEPADNRVLNSPGENDRIAPDGKELERDPRYRKWDPWNNPFVEIPVSVFGRREMGLIDRLQPKNGEFNLNDKVLLALGVDPEHFPFVHEKFANLLTALRSADLKHRTILKSDENLVELEIESYPTERGQILEQFAAELSGALERGPASAIPTMVKTHLDSYRCFGMLKMRLELHNDPNGAMKTLMSHSYGDDKFGPPQEWRGLEQIPPEFRHLVMAREILDEPKSDGTPAGR